MQKYVGTIFRRDGKCPNIQEAGNISHFTKNYHLPAKEKILLMHVYFPKIVMNINTLSVYPGYDLLSPEEFSLYLNKGTIKINYESIYGDCFELNSQNALDNLSIDYSSGRHGE